MVLSVIHYYSIMIAYDEHQCTNIFFALQNWIAITIEFHISYECTIMSEIITLHGYNCNRLLRHLIP